MWFWQQQGALTPLETIKIWGDIWKHYGQSDMYQLGTIIPYITTNPPPFTLPCDGSNHLRTDYPALYAALDAAFIVDADNFVTPDLRGRTVIGAGLAASGTDYEVNDIVGAETHSLTADENGAHSHTDAGHQHTYSPPGITALVVAPGEAPVTAINLIPGLTGIASANIQSSGLGEAHNNMQPSLALKYAVYAL